MTLRMADSAESRALAGLAVEAYAGYVDGHIGDQPNHARICAAFPAAHHLSIALFAGDYADCLDVEPGAAVPSQLPDWYHRQLGQGVRRPCVYASVSAMRDEVLAVLHLAGIDRAGVRLWTAHYGQGEHVCGPKTCGELPVDADGTQWTNAYHGPSGVVDMSLLADGFFGIPTPPAPVNWTETIMRELPLVRQGDADVQAVRTVQGLLCARGHAVSVDGAFGAATLRALQDFQQMRGLAADGIAGPATWQALLGVRA